MHRNYQDIISRISDPPIFYDEHGVPRYEPFDIFMMGVYHDFYILADIECQSCGRPFQVACGYYRSSHILAPEPRRDYTIEDLASGFHYGDPPAHRCVGDTMNCIDRQVLQVWEKNTDWNDLEHPYLRRSDLELPIHRDWYPNL